LGAFDNTTLWSTTIDTGTRHRKSIFFPSSLSIYSFYGLVDVGFSPAITSATTKKPLGFQTAFHSLSLSRLFPPPVHSSLIVTMFDTSLAGSDEQKDTTGKEMYKIKIKGETQEGTTPASGTWKRWVYNKCTSGSAAAGIG
jgi:hypothetical protein